jgi:hypothetical protein
MAELRRVTRVYVQLHGVDFLRLPHQAAFPHHVPCPPLVVPPAASAVHVTMVVANATGARCHAHHELLSHLVRDVAPSRCGGHDDAWRRATGSR